MCTSKNYLLAYVLYKNILNKYFKMYIVHCTLYIVQCIMYIVYLGIYTVDSTECIVWVVYRVYCVRYLM